MAREIFKRYLGVPDEVLLLRKRDSVDHSVDTAVSSKKIEGSAGGCSIIISGTLICERQATGLTAKKKVKNSDGV